MPDIHHRLMMSAPRDQVFTAVTRGVLSRAFHAGVHTSTLIFEEERKAVWRCVDGPSEWMGTEIAIEVVSGGEEVVLSFAHRNWRAESESEMALSATNWARLLLGIQRSVAFGEPEDTTL